MKYMGGSNRSTSSAQIEVHYARADNEMKHKAIESVSVMTDSVSPEAEEAAWDGNEEMIKRLLGFG